MIIINHRVNNLKEISHIPLNHGIEVDVRYHQNNIILNHDPFNHHIVENTKLIDLLDIWKNNGPLILNLKTEGIEEECINLITKYKVENWFFLDMSPPFLIKYAEKAFKKSINSFSKKNLAVRFSDKEPIEYVLSFKNKADWVWVDYFSEFPLNKKNSLILKKANFKICLVSPELQENSIFTPNQLVKICNEFDIDAVCTKYPEIWI